MKKDINAKPFLILIPQINILKKGDILKGAGVKGFNPLRHYLVPEMKVMSKKEAQKLLEELHTDKDHLPKIKISDPEAVALGAQPGDIIEIKRKDPTGENIYYRVVVDESE